MSGIKAVAVPSTATPSEWFDLDDRPWRFLHGPMHTVAEGRGEYRSGEISVQAEATQYTDGDWVKEEDYTEPPGIKLTAALTDSRLPPLQARRLALCLVVAADEVDGWVGR